MTSRCIRDRGGQKVGPALVMWHSRLGRTQTSHWSNQPQGGADSGEKIAIPVEEGRQCGRGSAASANQCLDTATLVVEAGLGRESDLLELSRCSQANGLSDGKRRHLVRATTFLLPA
jgi:hypothetical protein